MDIIKGLFGWALLGGPIIPLLLYIPFSIWLVRRAIRYARENGKSAKRWGWGTAFVMYSLVFWDWIPTVAVHQYYCAKDSGFWIYKTLDQWKAENLGGIGTLEGRTSSTQKEAGGYTETHQLNQRFNWVIKLHDVTSILKITKRDEILVDAESNEVLARFIDFSSGDQRSTGTTKFWMVSNNCNAGEEYRVHMGQLVDKIYADAKGVNK